MNHELLWIDLLAIGGIILEIWGFWWLLRYGRDPKHSEFEKWKIQNDFGDGWKLIPENFASMYLDEENIRTNRQTAVPKDFVKFWKKRKSYAIILVIIGLSGQLAQIIILDLIQLVNYLASLVG